MLPADFELLRPHLRRAPLLRLQTLVRPDVPIETVYFPEGGIVSIVASGPDKRRTEVGLFGWEGMSGVSVLLAADRTPHETFVQVDGTTALHISVVALLDAMASSVSLQALLHRYAHVHAVQVAAAVVTLAGYNIEQRLARWLLMCHDRIPGDDIALTHEFLSMMLGTRRAGVTEAMHVLEGDHLVHSSRGHVLVCDRQHLIDLAGTSYGQPEAEYRRLIGPLALKPERFIQLLIEPVTELRPAIHGTLPLAATE